MANGGYKTSKPDNGDSGPGNQEGRNLCGLGTAYISGNRDGYAQGYCDGRTAGYMAGKKEGYEAGVHDGRNKPIIAPA